MSILTRRTFLKSGAMSAAALGLQSAVGSRTRLAAMPADELVFRPYPHASMPAMSFAYLTDGKEDPFQSATAVRPEGIVVGNPGAGKFSVNARWYVEGFGYIWLAADNAGALFDRDSGVRGDQFNLNHEFARSREARNRAVRARYEAAGSAFSPEVGHLMDLSAELLQDASKRRANGERCAALSDRSLLWSLRAGELVELEHARSRIAAKPRRDRVSFGCETRQYVWAKHEDFTKRFTEVFNFATITHYLWDTWYELFEPSEGVYNWGIKDNIVNWLTRNGITIQGRPLFWFHPSVTPEWLKIKTFDQVRSYVDSHTRNVLTHYGDKILQWEIVNEFHDWANIHDFTPDQITRIVRQACDRTKEVNPKVVRVLNNCCPWADYAARGRKARGPASRPPRSPRKFLQDLQEAGVEYDVLGIQIYFPQRDLSDIARLLERLETFGKPIYITEIGASSNLIAPSSSGAVTGTSEDPYAWHRHWDEDLQADWLEQVYTMYYARPSVIAINWYDFSDFRPFIVNGGLIREDASVKRSFTRLKTLLASWNALPRG
jgi:GH35 family endo-1,4-beta-xylanase